MFTANTLSGAPYHAIMATAHACTSDIVILDLNPNAGDLNRCVMMSSHYVVVPTIADYYSTDCLEGMEQRLLGYWVPKINLLRAGTQVTTSPFPPHSPKFVGIFLSRYIPNRMGEIQNGLAQDDMPYNDQYWAVRVEDQALRMGQRLATQNPPLAISEGVLTALSPTLQPTWSLIPTFQCTCDLS